MSRKAAHNDIPARDRDQVNGARKIAAGGMKSDPQNKRDGMALACEAGLSKRGSERRGRGQDGVSVVLQGYPTIFVPR